MGFSCAAVLGHNGVRAAVRLRQTITAKHLCGLPGLRVAARGALLGGQPSTVREALRIPDVCRKTTRHLLELGLITDPDGLQPR